MSVWLPFGLLVATALSVHGRPPQEDVPELDRITAALQELVYLPTNELCSFRPLVGHEPPAGTPRPTPLVWIQSPWDDGAAIVAQVPEYAFARVPGDVLSGHPFFFGQSDRGRWLERYPTKVRPQWERGPAGGLRLASELEGGYRVFLEVRPGDRLVELRFGVENGSESDLLDVWVQFCLALSHLASVGAQDPLTCSMISGGRLLSWDGYGQDLGWIETFRDLDGRLAASCFFSAYLPDAPGSKRPERYNRLQLARPIDLPLLAKSDAAGERHLVLYSPFGRKAFLNARSPCAHTDPFVPRIAPGETRWMSTYLLFVEGDVEPTIRALVELDRRVRNASGILGGAAR